LLSSAGIILSSFNKLGSVKSFILLTDLFRFKSRRYRLRLAWLAKLAVLSLQFLLNFSHRGRWPSRGKLAI